LSVVDFWTPQFGLTSIHQVENVPGSTSLLILEQHFQSTNQIWGIDLF